MVKRYSAVWDNIGTPGVADQLKTMLGIIMPDTADIGFARIRSLELGPADETAEMADKSVLATIERIDDVSAGTAGTAGSTISVGDMGRPDSAEDNPPFTVGRAYTAEPTAFATEKLFAIGTHLRNGFIKYFDDDEAPIARRDQLLAVRLADRDGAAILTSGSIQIEVVS